MILMWFMWRVDDDNHVLNDVEIWFAEHRVRGSMNSLALSDGVDVQEVTVFGDLSKRRIAGLRDVELSAEGYYDNTYDAAFMSNLALANVPVMISPLGGVHSSKVYMTQLLEGEYSKNAAVGETYSFSLSGSASSGAKLQTGQILHNGVVTADGNGAGIQLGALTALVNKLTLQLHVLDFTNANPTSIIIESDDNSGFTTPTTRFTFNVTAVGAQVGAVLTSVTDVWWRARWDVPAAGGPSVSFALGAGINSALI